MEQMEAGVENYDNAMVAVGIGGAVVGTGLTKIAPKSTARTMKKVKSYTRKKVDKIEKECPRCFASIIFTVAVVNLALYLFDLITDGIVTATFHQYNHTGWFTISLGMMVGQYLIAVAGIVYYLRKEEPDRYTLLLLAPLAPAFLDVLMFFYRPLQRCLPDKLVTFMVQYEATRTLSETILESVPQMALQIYIYFYCAGNETMCDGITQEAGTALVQSMIISGMSILFHLVQVFYEMKKEGLGFFGYLKSLVTMGA